MKNSEKMLKQLHEQFKEDIYVITVVEIIRDIVDKILHYMI